MSLKVVVVEVGGCPETVCEFCTRNCSKNHFGLLRRQTDSNPEIEPCTVGYYIKPQGVNLGRVPLAVVQGNK